MFGRNDRFLSRRKCHDDERKFLMMGTLYFILNYSANCGLCEATVYGANSDGSLFSHPPTGCGNLLPYNTAVVVTAVVCCSSM